MKEQLASCKSKGFAQIFECGQISGQIGSHIGGGLNRQDWSEYEGLSSLEALIRILREPREISCKRCWGSGSTLTGNCCDHCKGSGKSLQELPG